MEARSLAARWLGAAALRAKTFGDVASDPRALGQASIVVLVSGIARGLGAFPDEGWLGLLGGTAVGFAMWILATALVWGIGVHWLEHDSGFSELARALGFAAAPFATLVLYAVLPQPASRVAWGVIHLWATLAFAVAVRQALGVSRLRAVSICVGALAGAFVLLLGVAAFLFDSVFLD